MITFPNAKINIGLNILRKRADEFHDIESLFYPVAFFDVLELVKSKDFEFKSTGLGIPGYSDNNLCIKAYNIIKNDYSIGNVKMHLHKVIPMGSGLGGGSSNGAFCINMLNELFELNIPIKKRINYAAQLGSDCPFFIENRSAFATGKGEILRPFNVDLSGKWIILVNPNLHVSTADAFSGVTVDDSKTDLIDNLTSPLSSWKESIINKFETSVFRKYPQIESLKKEFYNSGAVYASMTGSGSTIYGIFDQEPTVSFNQFFTWKGRL